MFEVNEKESKIYFYDVVGADFFGGITDGDFKKGLDSLGGKDVQIHVNSPGGDVWTGLAIYNLIKAYPGKTTVIVDALAASAASYFPMAADEILMHENSLMMIHAPMSFAFGNSVQMMEMAEVLDKHADAMSKAYESRSGKSAEEITEIFNKEVWYTASETVDNGFADSVIDGESDYEVQINNKVFNFKHAPSEMVSASVPKFAAFTRKPNGRKQLEAKVKIKALV